MKQPGKHIALRASKDEPEFVAFYELSDLAIALVHETLIEVIPRPSSKRRDRHLHWYTIYLGTMFEELATAASQLVLLDMPRAAVIASRQVYEYSIRTRYLHSHPEEAEKLVDMVQRRVWEEAVGAKGHFEPEFVKALEANYRAWAADNPELDSGWDGTKFTPMAKKLLGDKYHSEFFRHYAYPSIIAHGKPHGMIDVLHASGDNVISHYWDSRTIDGLSELSKLTSMTIEYVEFIRSRYGLDVVQATELNERHGAIQMEFGYIPTTRE